jgi:hypothetical protein
MGLERQRVEIDGVCPDGHRSIAVALSAAPELFPQDFPADEGRCRICGESLLILAGRYEMDNLGIYRLREILIPTSR